MRRSWLLVAAAALTVAAACRQYLPVNRYVHLRRAASHSTADARRKFNHGTHGDVFAAADTSCIDCHRFDATVAATNEQAARELSAAGQYPGSAACHYCHGAGAGHVANAPQRCGTCHENLAPLRPENHDVGWGRVHASMARANPQDCETCHRQSFCIDCHQRRDSIQPRVHERNFRFFHSVEARAHPRQCGSCPRQDFCIRCHETGKVRGEG